MEKIEKKIPLAAITEGAFPQLNLITFKLNKLADGVSVLRVVTPMNLASEKETWMMYASSHNFYYVPDFKYNTDYLKSVVSKRADIEKILAEVNNINAYDEVDRFMIRLMKQRIYDLLLTIGIAEGILAKDDDRSMEYIVQKYGLIDPNGALAVSAHEVAAKMVEEAGQPEANKKIKFLQELRFGPDKIVKVFKKVLEIYNEFTQQKTGKEFGAAILSNEVTAITVCENEGDGIVIKIPENHRLVDGLELSKLVKHEIECHVRDSFNGRELLRGLCGGKLHSEQGILREGHAMLKEAKLVKQLGGKMEIPKPFYTIAIVEALNKVPIEDIAIDMFERMLVLENQNKQRALERTWTILYRTLFRGRSDFQSKNYIFLKDKCYFEGYFIARQCDNRLPGRWLETGVFSVKEFEMFNKHVELPESNHLLVKDLKIAEKIPDLLAKGQTL